MSKTLTFSCLCALTVCAPAVHSQTAPKKGDINDIAQQQKTLLQRTSEVAGLMEAVATRLIEKGQTSEAERLRAAAKEVRERGLVESMDTVVKSLKDQEKLYSSIEGMATVRDGLDSILNILLDLKAKQDLDKKLEEAKELQKQIHDLTEEQQSIRKETEKVTKEREDSDIREAREAIEKLQTELKSSDKQMQAGSRGDELGKLDDLLTKVDQLRQEQKELQAETSTGASESRPELEAMAEELGKLIAGQQNLRDQIAGERVRQEAIRDLEKLAAQQRKLTDETRAAASSKSSGQSSIADEMKSLDVDTGEMKRLAEALANSAAEEGGASQSEEAAEQAQKAAEELAKAAVDLGVAAEILHEGDSDAAASIARKAQARVEKAKADAAQAATAALDAGETETSKELERIAQTASELARGLAAMADKAAKLAQGQGGETTNDQQKEKLAEMALRQDDLRQEARRIANQLEQSFKGEPELNKEMDQAKSELSTAADALEQQAPDEAADHQDSGLKALERALAQVKSGAAAAANPKAQAEQQAELKAQAEALAAKLADQAAASKRPEEAKATAQAAENTKKASERMEGARATLGDMAAGKGDPSALPREAERAAAQGAQELEKALESLRQAVPAAGREKALAGKQGNLEEKSRKLRDQLGRDAAAKPRGSKEEEAARKLEDEAAQAADQMRKATATIDQPEMAGNHQKEALEHLDQLSEALKEQRDKAASSQKRDLDKLAAQQRELEAKLRDLKKRLLDKSAKKDQPTPEDAAKLEQAAAKAGEAASSMADAARNAEKGAKNAASKDNQRAQQALADADKALGEMTKDELSEEQRRTLERLTKRQEELEDETAKLEEKLKEKGKQRSARAAKQAQVNMGDAAEKLKKGDSEDAEEDEKEAEENLAEAQKEVDEEVNKYVSQVQAEKLFEIARELRQAMTNQERILASTKKLEDEKSKQDGRLSRPSTKDLADTRRLERDEIARLDRILPDMEKEGARVYTWQLHAIHTDLDEISGMLEEGRYGDTGERVQFLEAQSVAQLNDLIASLEEQGEKKKQQGGGGQPPPPPPGGGTPPLIPPVAELRMLKQLQISVKNKVESFVARNESPDPAQWGPVERMQLRRIAHEQGDLAELARQLVEAYSGQLKEGGTR